MFQPVVSHYWIRAFNFLGLVLLLGLSACEEPIDLPLATADPVLVVEGMLSSLPDRPFTVRLSRTSDYYNVDPNPITNAIITLTDGESTWEVPYSANDKLYALQPRNFRPLRTYTLTIRLDGKVYETSQYMDTIPEIIGVSSQLKTETNLFYKAGFYYLTLIAQDPPNVANNYRLRLYKRILRPGTPPESSDSVFVDSLYNGIEDLAISDDRLFDGALGVFPLQYEFNKLDTVTLELSAISADTYKYLQDYRRTFFAGGSPFSRVPANPAQSIFNIADPKELVMGHFAVEFTRQKQIVVQ